MKMFLIRFISALVLLLVVSLLYLWLGDKGLLLITSAVVLYGTKELVRMFWGQKLKLGFSFFVFLGVFCHLLSAIEIPFVLPAVFAIFVILCVGATFTFSDQPPEQLEEFIFRFLFLFFYLGVLPSFVLQTILLPAGAAWFLFHMTVVFAGDTFAYFVGKKWGRRPLLPSVSPKKTCEGALGGLLGSVILGVIVGHIFFPEVASIWFAISSVLVGGVAQMGDLLESLIKRKALAKDSGRLIPGHGGVLDRVDGVILSAPVVYILALWIHNLSSFVAFG